MEEGRLYETQRIIKGGKYVGSRVVWFNRRVGAEICAGEIILQRKYGTIGTGSLQVTLEELGSLSTQSVIWMQERESWAVYIFSSCDKEEVRGSANSYNREIWRVGEKHGNPAGEKVGKIHQISERLVVEARRHELTLRIGEKWTTIEPGEDAFLCALYLWAKNQSN